jgi:isopenicillin N synthase-like dioxygenase
MKSLGILFLKKLDKLLIEDITKYFTDPVYQLKMLFYPENTGAISAHTDFGFIAMLVSTNISGFQVLNEDDVWEDISMPDAEPGDYILINVGDMLQMWSNGVLKSTMHRVVNSYGHDRYSLAFFLHPSKGTKLTINHQETDTFAYLMSKYESAYKYIKDKKTV